MATATRNKIRRTAKIARAVDPIDAAMTVPRLPRDVVAARIRAIRQGIYSGRSQRRALKAAYAGGLPAEQAAARAVRWVGKQATLAARAEVRAAYLEGVGRRIDLLGLLSLSRASGAPVWTIADPCEGRDQTAWSRRVNAYCTAGTVAGSSALVNAWGGHMDHASGHHGGAQGSGVRAVRYASSAGTRPATGDRSDDPAASQMGRHPLPADGVDGTAAQS